MTKIEIAQEKHKTELAPEERIALAVIYGGSENSGLHDRGGFDHFWDNLPDDIADEMWDEIIGNIREAL